MGWDGADYVQVLPLEKRNALRWRSRRLREADVVGAGRWWPPAYPESQIPHRGARYTVRILSPYRPLLLLIINLDATKVPNYLRCSHLHVGAAIAHMLHLKPFMRRSPSRVLLVVVNIEAAVNRIIMLDMQGLSYSYFCTLSTRPPPPPLLVFHALDATNTSSDLRCSHSHACRVLQWEGGRWAEFYLVGMNIEAAVYRIIMLDTEGVMSFFFLYAAHCSHIIDLIPPTFYCWHCQICEVIECVAATVCLTKSKHTMKRNPSSSWQELGADDLKGECFKIFIALIS